MTQNTQTTPPALTLAQLTTDYLKFLRVERGCFQRTIYTYASWLRHYTR